MAYANIKYMCSNMVSNLSANLQERYVHMYLLGIELHWVVTIFIEIIIISEEIGE